MEKERERERGIKGVKGVKGGWKMGPDLWVDGGKNNNLLECLFR